MACRVALMALLPPASSAIWLGPQTSSLREFGADESSGMENMMSPGARADCQDVTKGSTCYDAVAWLRSEIFKKHPSWYPGYTSKSSVEDVQDMLYGLGKASCPRPCFSKAPVAPIAAVLTQPKFDCRDTSEGDLCYQGVAWLKEVGLQLHPDWYPGLSTNASVPTIQSELHRSGKADCPRPCALTEEQEAVAKEVEMRDPQSAPLDDASPEKIEEATEQPEVSEEYVQGEGDDCEDAKPQTMCYNDVSFGLAEGVKAHQALYDGLTEFAHFKDIQEFLYLNNRSGCRRPCPVKHVPLDELAKNPESLREKKRIEDMTIAEMSKYLTGEWNGYVAKVFTSDNQASSTFLKRVYNPTTTVVPEEAMPLPLVDNRVLDPPDQAEDGEDPSEAVNDTDAVEANVTETNVTETNVTETNVTVNEDETPIVTEEMANAEDEQESLFGGRRGATREQEQEEGEIRESGLVPETDAARAVMACLQNMSSEATPETFGELRLECESIIAQKLPETGKQEAALKKESVRHFVWAQHHVEVLKVRAREEELKAMAREEEAKAEEQRKEEEKQYVDEPMPEVDGDGQVMAPEGLDPEPEQPETKEDMELRIRKQVLEELMTTTAAHEETEEEMRQRIKADVMRDLEVKARTA